jgi:DNA-directed RNA polymerase subunit omega
MARITVEDCLEQVDNRFALIHLAAKRVRQLRKGVDPLVVCKNKDIVTSLREIAAGKVIQDRAEKDTLLPENQEDQAFEALPEETEVEIAGDKKEDDEARHEDNQ